MESTGAGRDASPGELPGLTVLVVAMDPSVLAVTRRLLERRGFRTLLAPTAADARSMISGRAGEIAGLVLDLTMPGMDAESVFEALRERRAEVPVLLTGGYAEDAVAARLVRSGPTDFLAKPFGLAALARKAGELFRPSGPRPLGI